MNDEPGPGPLADEIETDLSTADEAPFTLPIARNIIRDMISLYEHGNSTAVILPVTAVRIIVRHLSLFGIGARSAGVVESLRHLFLTNPIGGITSTSENAYELLELSLAAERFQVYGTIEPTNEPTEDDQ